jgi:hypothetical protein
MRGLDPRIHRLRKTRASIVFARRALLRGMDCRVNPRIKSGGGNDELDYWIGRRRGR